MEAMAIVFLIVVGICAGTKSCQDTARDAYRDHNRAECVHTKTVAECKELFP